MKEDLSKDLFEVGKPLSASRWNKLVDKSETLTRSFSHEHRDGIHHVSPRIESAICALEWDGSWKPVSQSGIELTGEKDYGNYMELEFYLHQPFMTKWDYAVLPQLHTGAPAMVLMPLKEADHFILAVPGSNYRIKEDKLTVVVYGRRYV